MFGHSALASTLSNMATRGGTRYFHRPHARGYRLPFLHSRTLALSLCQHKELGKYKLGPNVKHQVRRENVRVGRPASHAHAPPTERAEVWLGHPHQPRSRLHPAPRPRSPPRVGRCPRSPPRAGRFRGRPGLLVLPVAAAVGRDPAQSDSENFPARPKSEVVCNAQGKGELTPT